MSFTLLVACAAILVSQSFAQVVINEVLYDPVGTDTGNERVELKNIGSSTVDLTGYDLYPDDIGYFSFPVMSLTPGSLLVVHLRQSGTNSSTDVYHATPTSNLGNSSGSVAIFKSTTHSSSTLVSFVQWGASNKAWSSAAVSAGFWSATSDSVPQVAEGHSIEYDGSGISPSDWFDQSSPTIGMRNALPVTWISFQARETGNDVELLWRTAEEPDNYGFRIERRHVTMGQKEQWTNVGFVQSQAVLRSGTTYRFLDRGLIAGRFAYRLRQIDRSGSSSVSSAVEIELREYKFEGVLRSYPNPFNPSARIEFGTAMGGAMKVEVYDLRGSRIAVLFDGEAKPEVLYSREFDAGVLSAGIYIVRSSVGGVERAVRIALVR